MYIKLVYKISYSGSSIILLYNGQEKKNINSELFSINYFSIHSTNRICIINN